MLSDRAAVRGLWTGFTLNHLLLRNQIKRIRREKGADAAIAAAGKLQIGVSIKHALEAIAKKPIDVPLAGEAKPKGDPAAGDGAPRAK